MDPAYYAGTALKATCRGTSGVAFSAIESWVVWSLIRPWQAAGAACQATKGAVAMHRPARVTSSSLKADLQSELCIERLTGPDARRPIEVADGVVELKRADGRLIGVVAAAGTPERRSVVGTVKQVIELKAQLRIDTFVNLCVFEYAEVQLCETRRSIGIASAGSPCSRRWISKSVGVEPLRIDSEFFESGVGVLQLVGALVVLTCVVGLIISQYGKREAVVEGEGAIELPALSGCLPMGRSGNLVCHISDEGVATVEIALPVITFEVG